MPADITTTATGPRLSVDSLQFPSDQLTVEDNFVPRDRQGEQLCLMMVGDDVMALDTERVDALIAFLTHWRARTGPFDPSLPRPERDWCEACKDIPAGQRWLCSNRPHQEG